MTQALDEELQEVMQQMISEGRAFYESNTLDGHKATRIGADGGFYCNQHDENNY